MIESELKNHDTIVVGWDSSGNVTYCRTFDYPNEHEAAQAALKIIIDKGQRWVISDTELFLNTKRLKDDLVEEE